MKKRQLAPHLLISVPLLIFYATSYGTLLQYRADSGAANTELHFTGLWNLPPVALQVISGEFKGLMADYLTLEAGAQLGTELKRTPEGKFQVVTKKHDWPSIHRLFVNSQILDPAFQQTYLLAQGWLPWDANMIAETNDILKTAAENRPWDWQPLHIIGFNSYYFLNQPGEAGKFFLEAAKTPNAPAFLPIIGARLAQKGGETKTAIAVMQSMLADKNAEEPGYEDMLDRLHALQGVLVIEEAVQQFQETIGRKPAGLDELISSGTLAAMPPNPYNLAYCMDAEGIIYFDRPDCATSKQ